MRGGQEPELPRKNAVRLFYGAAFHDVVFARVPGCDVVRLYDWEVRMGKLACLFFPEECVVKGIDIRAENIGALEAGVGLAVPAALMRGCMSTPGFLARMEPITFSQPLRL